MCVCVCVCVQVNCLAFNPYSEYILATGSADKVCVCCATCAILLFLCFCVCVCVFVSDCGSLGPEESEDETSFV